MEFNPDISKQAQEEIFSRKTTKLTHSNVFFNGAPVTCSSSQKHPVMYLDETLNFTKTSVREIGLFKTGWERS